MPAITEHQKACPGRLLQWSHEMQAAFAHLSKPQVWGLVRMSARGSRCQEQQGLHKSVLSLRWCWTNKNKRCFNVCASGSLHAKHKSGKKRRELDVTSCFAPPLRWIVHLWGNGNREMVLVLDATTLSDRWTILSISVVIRSCAIPVARISVGRAKDQAVGDRIGKDSSRVFRAVFQMSGRSW